ncbi:MAG: hypothetical protein JAY88_14720 [Candidatus Thiodiazotropha lotti]|nr:hypothetical protein [Candidatus Thiodiazotropha lotti]MCW4188317.1 hypothetical protein [Candidatus Thiodiazotropha lotti]
MSFFSALFSTPKAAEKTVDLAGKGIDAMFFTDEEKSQANLMYLDWLLKFHEASKGSNLARRMIATMVVGSYVAMIVAVFFIGLFGFDELAAKQFQIANKGLGQPVSVIVAFYFTASILREFAVNRKKGN